MTHFKFNPLQLLSLIALLLLILSATSCLPNGFLDKSKQTQCIYFIPKTMQILKACNDEKIDFISGPLISVKYDTITIVNGRPADRYTLFESAVKMNFPFSMDTIVKDNTKEIVIGLSTDKGNGYSYALHIQPKDWARDTLFFVFYYRK